MAARSTSYLRSAVEALEGRSYCATITVRTDYSWSGALYDAIDVAAPGDTVDFSGFRGTLRLGVAYAVTKSLHFVGPGADKLTITTTGANDRVFNVAAGLDVGVSGVRFNASGRTDEQGGVILMSGGIDDARGRLTLSDVNFTNNFAAGNGGAVSASFCDVALTRCRFAGNTATGVTDGSGGAIYLTDSSLTATDSTFDYNTAHANGNYASSASLHESTALGGAVALIGADRLSLTNCTFANNAADADKGSTDDAYAEAHGGGLFLTSDGDATIVNCTFASNAAGGTGALGFGGGLDVLAFGTADLAPTHTLKVVNTVIAANTGSVAPDAFGLDVSATALTNLKNNLIGDGTYSGIDNNVGGNRVGSAGARINPKLGIVTDNGGPVPTMLPQAGSPLLGNASAAESPTSDARGYARSGPFDIGAAERQDNYAPTLTVWPATVAVANTPFNSPIAAVDPDGNAITFTLLNAPAWLSLVDAGDGTARLVGTPTSTDGQASAITLRTSDGQNTSDQTVLLAVYVEPVTLDADGLLRVVGTESADVIKVWQPRGAGTAYRVMVGKRTRNYAAGAVKAIQVFGLGGDDTIVGNPADLGVYVNAGDGNDTVVGSANVDSLTAAAGDDEIWGMEGNDWIDGNGGRDRLNGGDGDDRIYGGNGNDTLDGGLGRDVLYGEVGSNLYLTADRNRDWVFATNAASNFVQGDLDRDLLTNAVPLPVVAATPRQRR